MPGIVDPQGRLYSPKEYSRRNRLNRFQFDGSDSYSYSRAVDMVRRNSLVGTMTDLYALWGRKASYKYVNDDREIYEFIVGTPAGEESQFYQYGQLQGRSSIAHLTATLSSYPIFGNLYAEFTPKADESVWGFGVLNVLEPGDYRYLRRKADDGDGFKGDIVGVTADNVTVPLEKSVYLKHGDSVSFGDPYGYAIYERLESLAQAWGFILEEFLNVIGQQGGKKVVGTVEDGESKLLDHRGRPLMGSDGEPIEADNAWLLAEQLSSASKNNDSVITSNKNNLQILDTEADGDIFEIAIKMFRVLMMMALFSPETIFFAGNSRLSDGNTAEAHASTLLDFIDSIAEAIAEEIQRVVIDPLVYWNFGPDRNRGALIKRDSKDPDRIELLKLLINFTDEALRDDESAMDTILSKVRELIS